MRHAKHMKYDSRKRERKRAALRREAQAQQPEERAEQGHSTEPAAQDLPGHTPKPQKPVPATDPQAPSPRQPS